MWDKKQTIIISSLILIIFGLITWNLFGGDKSDKKLQEYHKLNTQLKNAESKYEKFIKDWNQECQKIDSHFKLQLDQFAEPTCMATPAENKDVLPQEQKQKMVIPPPADLEKEKREGIK